MPFFLVLVLLVLGCSGEITGQHCYVMSGLYLIDGTIRAPVGHVEDIFHDYNTDPDLSLFYRPAIKLNDVWEHQTNGCRVVVVYGVGNGMNHSRPMEYHEQFGFDPIGYYISCLKGTP